jgi:hypothetical protein
MRDGVVSVAEPGARPSVSLLRALKREFGFYCIELCVQGKNKKQPEAVFVMGGYDEQRRAIASMERYDVTSGQMELCGGHVHCARRIWCLFAFAGVVRNWWRWKQFGYVVKCGEVLALE